MVAILFDADGVLIDSIGIYRHVWRIWAQSHRLDLEVVWRATFGRRPEDTVALTAPGLDPIVEHRALERLLESQEAYIEAFPGAAGLLARLGSTPWAVVTSGSRSVTTTRFARLGLPFPSVFVGGNDVQHGKPDPECYLQASNALAVPPADCVVIEDAPAGIAAGRAAGCYVVAVTTTHPSAACSEADEVLADLDQVASRLRDLVSG